MISVIVVDYLHLAQNRNNSVYFIIKGLCYTVSPSYAILEFFEDTLRTQIPLKEPKPLIVQIFCLINNLTPWLAHTCIKLAENSNEIIIQNVSALYNFLKIHKKTQTLQFYHY